MKPRPCLALWAVLGCSSIARAETSPPTRPQINAGLDVGMAGIGQGGSFWQRTELHLGGRGDVLFGRASPWDWGVGPMVGLGTNGFHDLSLAAGLSVLTPVHEDLPFVFTLGGYGRRGEGNWSPGVFGTIFWGSRSFNYDSDYGLAAGLLAEGRVGFGDAKERAIVIALHLDAEILAMPALLLINAFR